jgi:type IV secretory pathway VirB9-like protein
MRFMTTRLIGTALAALLLAPAAALAQQNGTEPVDTSTPWNPEQVPPQAVVDFGAKDEPMLVCAPTRYCALALETGETVQSAETNEDHWSVTPTTYGAGKLAKAVILVSPFAAGLKDELAITTTTAAGQPRTYKITLRSDAAKWTQLTSYRYPAAQ